MRSGAGAQLVGEPVAIFHPQSLHGFEGPQKIACILRRVASALQLVENPPLLFDMPLSLGDIAFGLSQPRGKSIPSRQRTLRQPE